MNTYIIIFAAGCALLLSFVLGVIVTDRIYQRVYDRSEERETPSPLSGTGNRVPGAMTGEDAEPSAAAGLTEEEKRRYEEERKAFDDCMKYNIDQAYGTAGKHGGA